MNYLIRARKAWDARRHTSALDRTTSSKEFETLVDRVRPADFLYWKALSWQKREEVGVVLSHMKVTVEGKRVLDLGPGYGDSLDEFHARGATTCSFVEKDPFLFTHNRHKPYATGVRRDFYAWLPDQQFDLVWSKASVSPLNFWSRSSALRWTHALVRRARPGGTILVCPYWARQGISRDQALRHWFARGLMDSGFSPVAYIPGHNEKWFPVSFRYDRRPPSPRRERLSSAITPIPHVNSSTSLMGRVRSQLVGLLSEQLFTEVGAPERVIPSEVPY